MLKGAFMIPYSYRLLIVSIISLCANNFVFAAAAPGKKITILEMAQKTGLVKADGKTTVLKAFEGGIFVRFNGDGTYTFIPVANSLQLGDVLIADNGKSGSLVICQKPVNDHRIKIDLKFDSTGIDPACGLQMFTEGMAQQAQCQCQAPLK
jgi:hypothetical protein